MPGAVSTEKTDNPDRATRTLPDYLVIGAAKSGTTTLYEYLCRHPGVFMCEPKEPEFFSRDEVYDKGLDWYASLFDDAAPGQLVGEASTTYSRWPHTADASARIGETLPDAKLIYILRNPVDRSFSHYAHHMRYEVTGTFEEALEQDSVYLDCSMYMDQLERYLRFFGRESFCVVLFEELRSDPGPVLAQVQRFLGLEERDLTSEGPLIANKTTADHFVLSKTTHRIRGVPVIGPLAARVPKGWRRAMFRMVRRSPVGKRLADSYEIPEMLPETRAKLVEHFREPNRRLAEFLGRDLSVWER